MSIGKHTTNDFVEMFENQCIHVSRPNYNTSQNKGSNLCLFIMIERHNVVLNVEKPQYS